jgi:hypothetical protein
MSKILEPIAESSASSFGTPLLLAAISGLALSRIVTTPAPVVFYYQEPKYHEQWKKGLITADQYYTKSAAAKNYPEPLWWGLVLLTVFFIKGDAAHKTLVATGLIAAGAITGAVYKSRSKDFASVKKEVLDEKEFFNMVNSKRNAAAKAMSNNTKKRKSIF